MANSTNILQTIKSEASKIWPKPVSETDLRKFLRRFSTDEPEVNIKHAWDLYKLQHIRDWRDRFGLDDHRPFRMKQSEDPLQVKWYKTYLNQRPYVAVEFNSSQPLTEYIPIERVSPQQVLNKVAAKIKTHATNQKLIFDENAIVKVPDSILLFQVPAPEHDWTVWKKDIFHYFTRNKIKFKKAKIAKIIEDFKRGKLHLTTVEDLEKYIKDIYDS